MDESSWVPWDAGGSSAPPQAAFAQSAQVGSHEECAGGPTLQPQTSCPLGGIGVECGTEGLGYEPCQQDPGEEVCSSTARSADAEDCIEVLRRSDAIAAISEAERSAEALHRSAEAGATGRDAGRASAASGGQRHFLQPGEWAMVRQAACRMRDTTAFATPAAAAAEAAAAMEAPGTEPSRADRAPSAWAWPAMDACSTGTAGAA